MQAMMRTGMAGELGLPLAAQLVATRRDLHRHAEPGWCEFRTSAKVVATLQALGWNVRFGAAVVDARARLGLPPAETIDRYFAQAIASGADAAVLDAMRGGLTGAVASLHADVPGPVVALRFDIDANWGPEAGTPGHLPARAGFASLNAGVHHNCGHDGHTAVGLAVARMLVDAGLPRRGELRLIFQPAEEGLRGANAMVAAGVLDGVDLLFGFHLGVQSLALGEVVAGYRNILASVKLDVAFHGRNAHAAISPHVGQNALLAACVAVQNLLALPRHGDGETRVNVGLLSGGESRNAIPARAQMSAELRADTTEILEHMAQRADRIVYGAASMQGVEAVVEKVGGSCAASSDPEMVALVTDAARSLPAVRSVRGVVDFKGSDDAAAMMHAVQQRGGKAVYFGLGTALAEVHHHPNFDFDEAVLGIGADLLLEAVRRSGVA